MAKQTYIYAACSPQTKQRLKLVAKSNDLYIHEQLERMIDESYKRLKSKQSKSKAAPSLDHG